MIFLVMDNPSPAPGASFTLLARKKSLKMWCISSGGIPGPLSSTSKINSFGSNQARKITIDSATMMNKGLEVIEAYWLFDLPPEKIDIVIHPQSIIHSMVEFADGSVKAQMGLPDMKIPIQYALTYPKHFPQAWEQLDLASIGKLTFEKPDFEKFECLQLAFDALKAGGTMPVVLNVANEIAVYRFLDGEIPFTAIPELITQAMHAHEYLEHPDLDDILALEKWAQTFTQRS